MTSTTMNWVHDKNIVTEKDRYALARAKRIEEKNTKKGYRWIRVDARNKLFIPTNEDGTPTKDGERMIENFKRYMRIK